MLINVSISLPKYIYSCTFFIIYIMYSKRSKTFPYVIVLLFNSLVEPYIVLLKSCQIMHVSNGEALTPT